MTRVRPFSNGSEFLDFTDANCERGCVHRRIGPITAWSVAWGLAAPTGFELDRPGVR